MDPGTKAQETARTEPPDVGDFYRHQKSGQLVRVVFRSVREDDLAQLVTYGERDDLGNENYWTRTVDDFFAEVDLGGFGTERFVYSPDPYFT